MRGQPPGRFPQNVTHGTHVAGLAAGTIQQHRCVWDNINAAPEEFPIIAVNLPTSIVSDTGGSFMAAAVVLGIQHILETAKKINGNEDVPVVINLSFALLGSGMGGARLISRFIDDAIESWRQEGRTLIFVLPAGNNFQDALVGELEIEANAKGTIEFEIDPSNRTSTFIEFVVETQKEITTTSDFRLELESEARGTVRDGPSEKIKLRSSLFLKDRNSRSGEIKAGVYYGFRIDAPSASAQIDQAVGREIITLALPPHKNADGKESNETAGKWTATLENISAPNAKVTVRMLRNDDPLGNQQQQTARLLNGKTADPNTCKITQNYSLNAIAASGSSVIVGASYVNREAMSPYSSAGPITPLDGGTDTPGVTLHAPADRNETERGLLGPGAISDTQNGRSKSMSGTSVAAPLVSRWFVNFLSQNKGATRADALKAILKDAKRGPHSSAKDKKNTARTGVGGLSTRLAGRKSR